MKTGFSARVFAIACSIQAVAGLSAAEPVLDWHALAGGGGLSSSELVKVFGTIGGPAPGLVSGGDVSIHAGFLSFAAVAPPPAQVITWTNVNGGNWMTPENWSPNEVPGPDRIAMINVPGTYTVTLDYDAEAGLLVLGGAPGVQSLNWQYGGFSGNMVIEANAVVRLTGESIGLSGTIRNRGRLTWPANTSVTWRFEQDSRFINEAGALMDLQGSGWFYGFAFRGVYNYGTIRKTADPGSIEVYPGFDFIQGGLLDVQAGTFVVNNLESSNRIHVAQSATLEVGEGVVRLHPGHSFTGTGNCWLNGEAEITGPLAGPVLFTVSEVGPLDSELHGTMWWTNGVLRGRLRIAEESTFNLLNFAGNGISLYGTLINQGRLNWRGTTSTMVCYETARIENKPGAVFDVSFDPVFELPAGAWFHNEGIFRKSAGTGTMKMSRQLTHTNSGTIEVLSGSLLLPEGLTSSGSIHVSEGAQLRLEGGDFHFGPNHTFTGLGLCSFGASYVKLNGFITGTVNFIMEYDAVFDCELNAPMSFDYGGMSGALTVGKAGVLALPSPGELSGSITNFGTVNWTGASSWRWSNTARFENKTGALLDMRADVSTYGDSTGLLFNEGTIRKSGGTGLTILNAPFTNAGTLEVRSGKIRCAADYLQTPAGTLNFLLPNGSAGAEGLIEFTKVPGLAGKLSIETATGLRPAAGTVFTLLEYPSAAGDFGSFAGLDLGGGLKLIPSRGPTAYTLSAGLDLNPPVSLTVTPGSLKIQWSADYTGWRLYSATNLLNPVWQPVPASGSTVEVPTTKPLEIFRLGSP